MGARRRRQATHVAVAMGLVERAHLGVMGRGVARVTGAWRTRTRRGGGLCDTGRVRPYRQRVLYGDTDQMGVVYYGNYLRFFEAARGDWIRNLGLTYAQIEERGIFLPVLEVGVRYLKPARYDDVLEIPLVVSHTRVKV